MAASAMGPHADLLRELAADPDEAPVMTAQGLTCCYP